MSSANASKLSELFDSWNPMKTDYNNSEFNQYVSGPGENLQPTQDSGGAKISVPCLIFKGAASSMSKKAMHNICARFGKVKMVRDSTKNDHYFVDFASLADMEAAFRGLETNSFGLTPYVAKSTDKYKAMAHNIENLPKRMPRNRDPIDRNRTYQVSEKNHPRPSFQKESIVNSKDYDDKQSLLSRNDPQRHYLIEDDAHALERAGHPSEVDLSGYSNNKFRTGRAYLEMPEKLKETVLEKHRLSGGEYNAAEDKYVYAPANHPKINIGKCDECQRACDIVCERCNTFYCGPECQDAAWPKHRYICGKPPYAQAEMEPEPALSESGKSDSSSVKLLALKKLRQKGITECQIPRSGSVVTITSISKKNLVFIRSKSYEDYLNFFNITTKLQQESGSLKPFDEPLKPGHIAVAKFGDQYNRAMLLNVSNPQKIKLVFIDYGNVDYQPTDQIYTAPDWCIDLPRLAIPVLLKNVPDGIMNDVLRKFMYSYLDSVEVTLKYKVEEDYISSKSVHQVELINTVTSDNFNEKIVKLSKPTESTDKICFREYLQQVPLPLGINIDLVVVDNSLVCTGCISCTTKDYYFEINRFQHELQRYAESLEPQEYAPRINELCIAKYSVDNKWYRGCCVELVGDGHPTILFVDYGNITLINIKDIRRYPKQFLFPIYTADCEIKGLPENCGPQMITKLEDLIPNGSSIRCELVQINDGIITITLPKVIQQLKAEGLLKDD